MGWLWILVLVAFWIGLGVLTAWVAVQRRRPAIEGAVLGFVFSLVGLVVELCLPMRAIAEAAPAEEIDDEPEPDLSTLEAPADMARGWTVSAPVKKQERPPEALNDLDL